MRNPQLEGEAFFWRGGPVGVLLIHGFTATTAEVRPLARTLAEHGFTVSGPLLPGHGTNPEALNRCRWQEWAGAVESAYRELAARCTYVVAGGESLGSLLALHLASVHPELSAVLAYAPALNLNVGAHELLAIQLLAPVMHHIEKRQPDDGLPWQGYTVYPLRAVVELTRLQRTVRRSLSKIRQPILVVQGGRDMTVHPSGPEIVKSGVRSAVVEVRRLAASGHCVILDKEWDVAARMTLAFLGRAIPAYSSVIVMAPSAQVDSQV